MSWTFTPPTEPGYYWVYLSGIPEIVHLAYPLAGQALAIWLIDETGPHDLHASWQWWSIPIALPPGGWEL